MKRILVPLCIGIVSAASAEEYENVVIADQRIETVVVSASFDAVPIDETGSAITIIDADTLQARQTQQVFDVLRDVPGVEVSRTGSVGSISQARIRGAEAGHTLVLIDGVRANDPGQSSEEFNFAHLMANGIDRIEVLRGPQSALWGADALSGVINVITVAPEPGFHARASAEYGSFDTKEVTGLINAGTEHYGAVVHASWYDTGGINIAHNGHENDGYRNTTVGARLRGEIAPDFVLTARIDHLDARTDSETTDFFGTYSIPLDSGDYTTFKATYARGEARWQANDAFDLIAGVSIVRTEAKDFSSAFLDPFNVAFNDRTRGGDTRFDMQGNLRWQGWGADNRISVRAETHRETFDTIRLDSPAADQKQHEVNSGIAAEYWANFDTVTLSLSARHDWNERFDDSTTWRSTVSWKTTDALRVHASAGTGVKNPDFYELFGFFPAPAFEGNPNLRPEKSFGWDAGIDWRAGERVVLDVTYFHADLKDEIFTDCSSLPTTARNASGESQRQGVEVSAHVLLGDGFAVDAAYTYLDAKESDRAAEIRRPHNIASVDLNWRFADDRALLDLGVDYHGDQKDTAFLNAPPFSQPVTLDSYTLVRVAGSYKLTEAFELYGRVENALDEKYEEIFGYRTRGFGVFGGIRATFD